MGEGESGDTISASVNGTRFNIGSGPRDSRGSTATSSGDANQSQNNGESGEAVRSGVSRGRAKSSKRTSLAEAKGAADMITGCIESLGVMRYGVEHGRMIPQERSAIGNGLTSSLQSLPASVSAEVARLSGPVMAAVGLILYAGRMANNERVLKAAKSEAGAIYQAEQVMRNHAQQNPTTAPRQEGVSEQNLDGMRNAAPADLDSIRGIMGDS